MIEIKNLHVNVAESPIIKGLDLTIKKNQIHAIMGPNGSGKSTLAKVIAGHPSCQVVKGSIHYEINKRSVNLFDLELDERAKEGIFLGLQYPVEIPGINNLTFMLESFNSICEHQGVPSMKEEDFRAFLHPKLKMLKMDESFLDRPVNCGFSGGEKKKNEILQMLAFRPRLAILDEIDSGLDVDALKSTAKAINSLKNSHNAIVLITHYQRLLDYIPVDFIHVFSQGKIVESGDEKLAGELEARGYDREE